jgi:hypothetical protein
MCHASARARPKATTGVDSCQRAEEKHGRVGCERAAGADDQAPTWLANLKRVCRDESEVRIRFELTHVGFYSQRSRGGINQLLPANNLQAFTIRGSNQMCLRAVARV